MNLELARNRVIELSDLLHHYNYLYYVKNESVVSDYDFDMLLEELEALEVQFPELLDDNSPSKRVGGDITKKFDTVPHRYPMLSLSNTYSEEEIIEWEERIKKTIEGDIEYVCELKYDGVAIGIRYINGIFDSAVTRGDGTRGELISPNVKTIKTIPLKLKAPYPEDFEIRGEIFMPLKEFQHLNQEREQNDLPVFANPRNTASGTLKLQDSSVVAERNLDCYLYGMYEDRSQQSTHFDAVEYTGRMGFKVPSPQKNMIAKVGNVDGILKFIKFWDEKRKTLPFEIDGIVIKVNNYNQQEELGFTAKSPRWAISFKYKTERAETQIQSVSYQVGRTGAITPVANLNPVNLGGTTVKRASLHNAEQIEKLDLHELDYVYVEKGGEIIPKIVDVNTSKRLQDAHAVSFITHCPDCSSELVKEDGEAQHYCPNEKKCPPQLKGKIEHFISRKAMNIDGIGTETIDALVENDMIIDISDLYELSYDKILELDRMADKSARNLLEGIENSKNVVFEKVLFGLGIRFVGETVSKKLAKEFKSIDGICNASYEELVNTDEIGEKIALSIRAYFSDADQLELIERLKKAGLCLEQEETALDSETFKDMSIVISGSFNTHSRDELKKLIEQNGGKNSSSISKKTSILVAGENMGPSKLKKATELNIEIINEEEFLNRIRK